ncbi:hypothetical protein BDZ90DRAFT_56427 [Jaminaea rosea]|uniref:Uncharacterized protein n=1 Tax=Jaminaea rosea TaxID=1569628 RepID=A0A316UL90_9BASI|nr:hypothetical protein BDZ90DRAFT_56427 [Jaminaea rosea]PWN26009.1 hypothetical protein BDZ90DRAFT_56427 [Jaminaea rosea]
MCQGGRALNRSSPSQFLPLFRAFSAPRSRVIGARAGRHHRAWLPTDMLAAFTERWRDVTIHSPLRSMLAALAALAASTTKDDVDIRLVLTGLEDPLTCRCTSSYAIRPREGSVKQGRDVTASSSAPVNRVQSNRTSCLPCEKQSPLRGSAGQR